MSYVTYKELVDRFGKNNARDLMRCIERLAEIRNDIIEMDSDKRFENALKALNDNTAS